MRYWLQTYTFDLKSEVEYNIDFSNEISKALSDMSKEEGYEVESWKVIEIPREKKFLLMFLCKKPIDLIDI